MAGACVLMPRIVLDGLPEDLRGVALPPLPDAGPVPADVLSRVVGYIPPYMCSPEYLALMAQMPALRWVQAQTAGVDGFWEYLPEGVVLANAAGVHDASTAELAVGLILASLRGLDDFARAMPAGQWLAGRRQALADHLVAVVGFGGLGRAIARRLAGFECDVVGYARSARQGAGEAVRAIADLPAELGGYDVVVLSVPLTRATAGLVDARFLARMADGALLVNVSRGPVVVTAALLAECRSGRLRAALDVTDPEPLPVEHPLWRVPGVLISPHVGGNSSAFQPRMNRLVAAQLARVCAGETLAHAVSAPEPGASSVASGRPLPVPGPP